MTTAQQRVLLEAAEYRGPVCARLHTAPGSDEPAHAEVGVLCYRCFNRTRYHLRRAAELVAHIAAQRFPSLVSPAGERVDTSKDPRIPWQFEASEALDELWSYLANWTTFYAAALGDPVPALLWPAADSDRSVERVPAGWSTGMLEAAASEASGWLLGHGRGWAGSASAAELHDNFEDVVRRLLGRWPLEEPPQRPASRSCGRDGIGCGIGRVLVTWSKGALTARCSACGWTPPNPDEFVANERKLP